MKQRESQNLKKRLKKDIRCNFIRDDETDSEEESEESEGEFSEDPTTKHFNEFVTNQKFGMDKMLKKHFAQQNHEIKTLPTKYTEWNCFFAEIVQLLYYFLIVLYRSLSPLVTDTSTLIVVEEPTTALL